MIALFFSGASWAIPSGHPNKGTLTEAVAIQPFLKKHAKLFNSISPAEFQYGTEDMQTALETVAKMAHDMKLAPLWVGDISVKNGGKIGRHLTHQMGLDADIGYLAPAKKRAPAGHRSDRYHNKFTQKFELKGKVTKSFSVQAHYELFKNMNSAIGVDSIFVGCAIYDELEKLDQKLGGKVMENIYAVKGHEDHFHLRLKCPMDAKDCTNAWWSETPPTPEEKEKESKESKEKYREC